MGWRAVLLLLTVQIGGGAGSSHQLRLRASHAADRSRARVRTESEDVRKGKFIPGANEVKKFLDDAHEGLKDALGGNAKPLMQKINKLRTEMCMGRQELDQHRPCMDFLAKICHGESTGKGLCTKFKKLLHRGCQKGAAHQSDLSSDHAHELQDFMCKLEKEHFADEVWDDEEEGEEDGEEGEGEKEEEKKSEDGDKAANETGDSDGDGIGDNSDDDIDGDGVPNDQDTHPKDASKGMDDLDGDQIPDDTDPDRDGDGFENGKDVFPNDPNDWKDTDKDGVGDNTDEHPFNPCCKTSGPCHDCGKKMVKPDQDIDNLDKGIPEDGQFEQGYTEVSEGPKVLHKDKETYTGDWGQEWDHHKRKEEKDKETIERYCNKKEHKDTEWCRKFRKGEVKYGMWGN